jgi:hypothetical protein
MPRLEAIGFSTRLEKLGDRGVPCLQAQQRPGGDIDIMFLGHMDTVFPTGEVKNDLFPLRMDGPTVPAWRYEGRAAGGPARAGNAPPRGLAGTNCRSAYALTATRKSVQPRPGNGSNIRPAAAAGVRLRTLPSRPPIRPAAQRGRRLSPHCPGAYRPMPGVEPEKGANAAVEIAHQIDGDTCIQRQSGTGGRPT